MRSKLPEERLFFSMTREFLDIYLPTQAGKSPHTVRAYRDALTVFRRYLFEQLHFSIAKFRFVDCTRDCVLDFLIYLEQNGNVPGTCNQRLTAIKSYIWFAADSDITLQPTALSLSRVPLRRKKILPRYILSEEELATILIQPANTRIGLRDRMIMILLYDSAVRLNEILGLTLREANLAASNPYIRIHGKGNRDRIVSITTRTVEHLKNYLSIYHAKLDDSSDFLFYTKIKGKTCKMSPGNVERLIQKYADMARNTCQSIPEKVYPHMFRRTRATHLYRNGVELELVSRILGHSSTETTKIYASPSLEMIRQAMEAVDSSVIEEKPLWIGNEEKMAKLCGLR